jgi:hypothetical protein
MGTVLHLDQFKLEQPALFHPDRFAAFDLGMKVSPSFQLNRNDRIFVLGSCFAAEVLHTLQQRGFLSTDGGQSHKYNIFSMLQSLNWALDGGFNGDLLAPLQDGRYFDGHSNPSRLFDSIKEGTSAHLAVLEQVRQEIITADVIVMTLGLVEVWRDETAGVWLNQTPPVGMVREPARFRACITTHAQNLCALTDLLRCLHLLNPRLRVICSVSPVPLKATFSGGDALMVNCYSKSTLRSVATEAITAVRHELAMEIDYFPAYELSTLRPREEVWRAKNIRDEPDGRHVRREFVNDVIMRLFIREYLPPPVPPAPCEQREIG